MKKTILILFLGFAGISASIESRALAEKVLARVNGKVISLEEFNSRYNENKKYFQGNGPSKKVVLDELIKREAGIQEAKRMGLDKDPAVVDRMNTVLYQALVEKKLGQEIEKIYITSNEARNYYDKNPEIRTSHIFVAVPPDANEEQDGQALDRIKKIRDENLRKGMGFAEAAQKFSEDPSAPLGGDVDYQTKDRLDPEYYAAAVKLKKPGNVSDIVRTSFGYHIIKLTAIKPWRDTDKPRIKRLVFEEQRQKLYQDYVNKLRDQANVSIETALLGKAD